MWFQVKKYPSCTDGAKNLWFLVKSSRYMPRHLLDIIDPVIHRNSYFRHVENILLAMLFDENSTNRRKAFNYIKEMRRSESTNGRIFKTSKINLDAESYIELINFDKVSLTEPPVTSQMTEEELATIAENGPNSQIAKGIMSLPCHTQAVERGVKVRSVKFKSKLNAIFVFFFLIFRS